MESEKVKEIKELFKNCDFTLKHCGNCVLWKDEDCIETIKSKVLTLIKELESENKRLLEQRNKTYNIWVKDTEKLKDRIAELENEIKENVFYAKGYAEGIKNTYEVVMPNKLKQFAEGLKENFRKNNLESGIWLTNVRIVDKTLKEFIGE
jgi:Txe/YoeB family toxin of Txe-Axe toxin-antitoxin module